MNIYEKHKDTIKKTAAKYVAEQLSSGAQKQLNVKGDADKIDKIRDALAQIQKDKHVNRVDAILFLCELYNGRGEK